LGSESEPILFFSRTKLKANPQRFHLIGQIRGFFLSFISPSLGHKPFMLVHIGQTSRFQKDKRKRGCRINTLESQSWG
jgi:hypothetical protein